MFDGKSTLLTTKESGVELSELCLEIFYFGNLRHQELEHEGLVGKFLFVRKRRLRWSFGNLVEMWWLARSKVWVAT